MGVSAIVYATILPRAAVRPYGLIARMEELLQFRSSIFGMVGADWRDLIQPQPNCRLDFVDSTVKSSFDPLVSVLRHRAGGASPTVSPPE